MRALQHLIQQEEKKLAQIGEQRNRLLNRTQQLAQQKKTLELLLIDYQKDLSNSSKAINWMNKRKLYEQLTPLENTIKQQLQLTERERDRLSSLWKTQLSKYQSLKWYVQQKINKKIQEVNKLEQKNSDDLAARKKLIR